MARSRPQHGISRRALLRGLAGCCLWLATTQPGAAPAPPEILVVTDQSAVQREIVVALRAALDAHGAPYLLQTLPSAGLDTALAAAVRPVLVVTLGSSAARALGDTLAVPVLHGAIPRTLYDGLHQAGEPAAHPHGHSALFLDQPPARQLRAVRLALPQLQQLGVLASAGSAALLAPLRDAAREQTVELVDAEVPEESLLIPRVEQLLRYSDALLVTPDARLYNRYSLQKVLLAAYRQRKPVIGLSAAYVTAGALLAVHSDPAAIGTDLAEMVVAVLDGKGLPQARHPRRYAVAINQHVARSLGLNLPTEEALAAALRDAEKAR